MIYGLGVMLVIAITGGAIAYIGDKLGSRIGKRRLSIFGLRPKNTAIIVTVATGILISALTLGILSVLSENVRIALFGMEKLRIEMQALNDDIAEKNAQIESGRKTLTERTADIASMNADILRTKRELTDAEAARDAMSSELIGVQEAFAGAESRLAAAMNEVGELEATKARLESAVTNLEIETKDLEEGLTRVREGRLLFSNKEVLAGATVRAGLTLEESELVLSGIINDTNTLIMNRVGETERRNMLFVNRENIQQAATKLAGATLPMSVRVSAASNVMWGEPAIVEVQVYPHDMIYGKGDVIWSAVMTGGPGAGEAVLSFLKDVNAEARARGVLPDPLTGDVGSVSGDVLFRTVQSMESMRGAVRIDAVATEDTYTDGPVVISLRIGSVDER